MTQHHSSVPPAQSDAPATSPAAQASRRERVRFSAESVSVLILLFILLLAGVLRFGGIDWDASQHLHPDERFLTDVSAKLQPTLNPLRYLDSAESPLNPYNAGVDFFVYGNFPVTVTRLAAAGVAGLCNAIPGMCQTDFNAYNGLHLVGRALSALLDLVSIAFLFLIGRRLYGNRVGLLAAGLLALAVFPIQQSHFFTVDNWAAALTTVALYAAVRASEDGKLRWWGLLGVMVGLAAASRINMALLGIVIVVAALAWLSRSVTSWDALWQPDGRKQAITAALCVLLATGAALATFRVAMPYAFGPGSDAAWAALSAETGASDASFLRTIQRTLGFSPQWVGDMAAIQRQQEPTTLFPPGLQWIDRAPVLHPLHNMILYGMGALAGVVAWAGFLWAGWRTLTGKPGWRAHLIPVAWIAVYFLLMGTRWVTTMRYFLPLYPALLLLGSWALVTVWRRAKQRRGQWQQVAAGGLIVATVLSSAGWATAFTSIYRQPSTRVAASAWMFDNIPSAASLLYTVDGESRTLHLPLTTFRFAPEESVALPVTLPEDGIVTGLRFNYLTVEDQTGEPPLLSVTIVDETGAPLGSTFQTVAVDAPRSAETALFDRVGLRGSVPYTVRASLASGSPVTAETSVILTEQWDDPLPIGPQTYDAYAEFYAPVDDPQLGYRGAQPIAFVDSAEKRDAMQRWLDSADYIALASQRNVWSLPRAPLTYPLTTAYYAALFNGDLGFELVHQQQTDPHLGPLTISALTGRLGWGDAPRAGWPPPGPWAAEEAFSVYDHAPVWIFAKTDAYDSAQVAALLGSIDLSSVQGMNPAQAGAAPTGLMLTPDAFATQRSGGTFSERFALDSMLNTHPWLAAAVWWALTVVLGWVAFPLTFVVLGGLPTRGYALARILALLLISWVAWWLGSLEWVSFGRTSLLIGLVLLGLASAGAALWRGKALLDFIRHNIRYLVTVEAIALGLFLLGIAIRLGNPDVWDVIWGGEKPMDLSYFNAVLKSSTFPPYNPWLSGSFINYYYYGFVLVAVPTLLLGIVPTTAYNLIIPMLFSFTGIGAFTVAANLVISRHRRRGSVDDGSVWLKPAIGAGMVALTLAILLGNLGEIRVVFQSWQRAGDPATGGAVAQTVDGFFNVLSGQPSPLYVGDWFFTATRAINFVEGEAVPITEFPFFTFLYADLHAHMISLPLTLLALGWAVSWGLFPVNRRAEAGGFGRIAHLVRFASVFLVGGIAVGSLYPTNSWDWPTYLVIGFLGIGLHNWLRFGRISMPMLGHTVLQIGVLGALSYTTFLPFWRTFGSGYTTIKVWEGSNTNLVSFFFVYGLFLLILVTHLVRELRSWIQHWSPERRANTPGWAAPLAIGGVAYALLLVALWRMDVAVAPVALTFVVVAGLLSLRPGLGPERRIVLALIAAAFFFTVFVELFVLDGDVSRMNTVFKFYMQVWILLSVTGGVAFVWLWPSLQTDWSPTGRRAWTGALGVLLFLALLYPVLATRAKWEIRMSDRAPTTLDGMVFMETTSYFDSGQTIELGPEYRALQWMQRHVDGSPVVMEAHGKNPYRSIASRVAMYTGLPAVVGWDWHQRQQRAVLPDPGVSSRIADVDRFYNTPDSAEAQQILDKYDVDLVYAGSLEHVYYAAEGLAKLDAMVADGTLNVLYDAEGVTIYAVNRTN